MNLNKILSIITRRCSLRPLGLMEHLPEIEDMLREETLSTFSQYFPYEHRTVLDLETARKRRLSGDTTIYTIEDDFLREHDLEIISVLDVSGRTSFYSWNDIPPAFDAHSIMLNATASSIRSKLNISSRLHEFVPPNSLRLTGYNSLDKVEVILKVPYPNFSTVPESIGEQLIKLCILDTKIMLWDDKGVKYYEDMETADSNTSLKIDWSNAQEDRDELIREFHNNSIFETRRVQRYE